MDAEGGSSGGHAQFRRQSNKRSYSTMEYQRSTSSSSSLFVEEDDHYTNHEHAARRPRYTSGLALPTGRPARYPGDGLDYRRPVMSSSYGTSASSSQAPAQGQEGAEVIDLTFDAQEAEHQAPASRAGYGFASSSRATRPPRFGRDDIINVDSESPDADDAAHDRHDPAHPPTQHNAATTTTNNAQSDWFAERHPRFSQLRRPERPPSDDMDDIEFVSERRSRPQAGAARQDTLGMPVQRSVTPYPPASFTQPIDLTHDDDDGLVHTRTHTRRTGVNVDRPGVTAGLGTRAARGDYNFEDRPFPHRHLVAHIRRTQPQIGAAAHRVVQDTFQLMNRHPAARTHREGEHPPNRDHLLLAPAFQGYMPVHMEYEAVGFDLGLAGGIRPPTPKYVPPPPAEDGFTRNPGEDEVVVCPNCGHELGMGDDERKQEVWVVKQCGHAYCGECAHNRTKGRNGGRASRKGKARATESFNTQPFKACVVHGCGKPAAHKSVVHVFLGS